MNDLINAIRSNELVGRGSCSTIDECMTDSEIAAALQDDGVKTVKGALKWALDIEGLAIENALNYRWGADDDPEVETFNRFNESVSDFQD
jgi:hypothetical protein